MCHWQQFETFQARAKFVKQEEEQQQENSIFEKIVNQEEEQQQENTKMQKRKQLELALKNRVILVINDKGPKRYYNMGRKKELYWIFSRLPPATLSSL